MGGDNGLVYRTFYGRSQTNNRNGEAVTTALPDAASFATATTVDDDDGAKGNGCNKLGIELNKFSFSSLGFRPFAPLVRRFIIRVIAIDEVPSTSSCRHRL